MATLGRSPGAAPLTSADIPDSSITTAKLIDSSVTSAKIGVDVIVAEDIANNAITVAEIADDAVTADKLANSINTAIAANTAKVSFTPDAAQVFNDTGADVDFRIEGVGNANALFVQGSDGNVGIGGAPNFPLSVIAPTSSSTAIAHFQNTGTTSPSGLYVQFTGNAPGDRTDYYLYCTDTGSTNDISLYSDGGASFSGNVGIGTTAPSEMLHIVGSTNHYAKIETTASSGEAMFITKNGSYYWYAGLRAANDLTAWHLYQGGDKFRVFSNGNYDFYGSDTSDRKYKENIIDTPYGLAEVLLLTPRQFNAIKEESDTDDISDSIKKQGFIAQEAESIVPNMVNGDSSEDAPANMGFDYNGMTAVLVKSIQELSTKVTALENA